MRKLREIALKLFEEVEREKHEERENNQVPSDELLSALRLVFPQTLLQALDLIDRQLVTRVLSPQGREAFQVKGLSGRIYLCLMSSEYCTCPSYTYYVLMKEEMLMCKHVLAVHLSLKLGTSIVKNVSKEDFANILMESPS
ncbi:zinc finger SWIM domain-containing protein 7-like [Xenia sp. Carnegie-2017]|uniref:zinc finger SWIM domain-containing protein 7-like n=1 Tax=Xenia sp. Carnegie-2017 TaxID=2897299 RepID=UPI001F047BDE|nr:zinc finger SWIM domain-containing protein 7-like [Xenia sp. Carnegie-2017]